MYSRVIVSNPARDRHQSSSWKFASGAETKETCCAVRQNQRKDPGRPPRVVLRRDHKHAGVRAPGQKGATPAPSSYMLATGGSRTITSPSATPPHRSTSRTTSSPASFSGGESALAALFWAALFWAALFWAALRRVSRTVFARPASTSPRPSWAGSIHRPPIPGHNRRVAGSDRRPANGPSQPGSGSAAGTMQTAMHPRQRGPSIRCGGAW